MTPDELRSCDEFNKKWYYSMELLPGMYTNGRDHANIALTRALLGNTAIEGKSCLDIGIQEGLFCTLLERMGAGTVVGYDWIPRTPRIDLLRATMGVGFEYIHGFRMAALRHRLKELGHGPFDVVVFSGVLYHMFDPLAGLSIARGLLRDGGILILETSCILDDQVGMHFNAGGRFYKHSNYWQISVSCMDYLLRFLRLEALDCCCLKPSLLSGLPLTRACVACRAVDHFCPDEGDSWMEKPRPRAYREFLNWDELASDDQPVAYESSPSALVQRSAGAGVDLLQSMQSLPHHQPAPEKLRLALDDKA